MNCWKKHKINSSTMAECAIDDLIIKEHTTLETFFQFLGQFAFDKAKDLIEKEKESIQKCHQANTIYLNLLSTLAQLAIAEKSYASLLFLVPKGFLRKDSSLKSIFETLLADLQRLEDRSNSCITPASSPPLSLTPSIGSYSSHVSGNGSIASSSVHSQIFEEMEKLAGHISGQLCHFVTARMEMMEFYEKMWNMSSLQFMKFEELANFISEIITRTQKLFHHPYLGSIKTSFSLECEILLQLLETQLRLQQWQFLPSLLHLNDAHSKLCIWAAPANKDGKKVSSHSVFRPVAVPPLYQWLCKLKAALVAKFSLYFHKILSQQTTPNEMKNLCSRAYIDYYQKIVTFQKRVDALCVALVLNTLNLESYKGHGYQYPAKNYEPPKGLDSYPAVLCYPIFLEQPNSHWPCVVMIMNDKAWDTRIADDVVCFYDKNVQTTYFLAKVDPYMTVVVILENKRTEKEGHITGFLHELCMQLRGNKVFASLKPGSK
ncbi:KICSTOR complex protein C12orf66-like isoform X2 [Centruroides sculpturatus]|uniref:KICSTOR complex protein C12orf66-like isoform X2 n=1 Tax=Centruroides sculpturatus TaxID=218467 RepID=UPI000C6DE750|nr:KICSTOR complex protein C12orf66-like isoform X2 [Centruroides sculpturatus]